MRPVGWPRTRRCGHSSARSRRSVISAASRFMWLCTLPITRSSSASASSARSIAPSLQDVALEAARRCGCPGRLRLMLAHLAGEGDHALLIQAVGHGQRLGVVGDGDVLVAALARGLGHLLERGAAVGLGGVHVEVAADVAQFHQFGQAAFVRRLRFRRCSRAAPAESTAGRAPRRLPSSVSPATRESSSTRNRPYSLSLSPILTARVRMATLWSLLPVKYCMAAPKLSGGSARTSTCRPSRPTLALALFSPRASTSSTLRIGDEALERGGGGGSGDQQVEIADGLAAAPQAAGGGDGLDARHLAQHFAEFGGDAFGVAQQIAAGALPVSRDGAQHLLFELGAHARQVAQLLLLAEPLQFVDGADVEVLEDERDALGAEALDLQELERGGREFLRAAASRRSQEPRSAISASTCGQAFADAGNVGDLALGVAQDVDDALRDSLRRRWRRCDSCGCGSRPRRRSPSDRRSPRAGARFPCSPNGLLHPIVSGRIGPFGLAARRLDMHACRRVFSVILLTFFAIPVVMAQSTAFPWWSTRRATAARSRRIRWPRSSAAIWRRRRHRQRWTQTDNCPRNWRRHEWSSTAWRRRCFTSRRVKSIWWCRAD